MFDNADKFETYQKCSQIVYSELFLKFCMEKKIQAVYAVSLKHEYYHYINSLDILATVCTQFLHYTRLMNAETSTFVPGVILLLSINFLFILRHRDVMI